MNRYVLLFVMGFVVLAGCMDELHDYNDCVAIEQARCALRWKCDHSFDQKTCDIYYEEFCRTRKLPGEGNVDLCVDSILSLGEQLPCSINFGENELKLLPACEFLVTIPNPDGGPDSHY